MKTTTEKVNVAHWLRDYQGRFSIGKRIDTKDALIYAYTDNPEEINKLGKRAKAEHLDVFRNISMKGVTCVEKG